MVSKETHQQVQDILKTSFRDAHFLVVEAITSDIVRVVEKDQEYNKSLYAHCRECQGSGVQEVVCRSCNGSGWHK